MDIVSRVARDLENEGVELSNEKILKILCALKSIIKVYYKVYLKNGGAGDEDLLARL
jgi:hypothetical protein